MLCKNAKKIPPQQQQQQQQKTMDRADTILLKEDGKSSCSINNRQNSSRAIFTWHACLQVISLLYQLVAQEEAVHTKTM